MTTLFTAERPEVYLLSQIYDPDTNPNGQNIPRVGSIVIDISNGGVLFWVESVDPITQKAILRPTKSTLIAPDDDEDTPVPDSYIVDYGNTKFFTYFDETVSPSKVYPDGKLLIVGNNNAYYKLFKWSDTANSYSVISEYYDNNGTVYVGTSIPLISATNNSNVKILDKCYTSVPLVPGDTILIRIFDANGVQTAEIATIAKEGMIASQIPEPTITAFQLSATQELGNKFYLYPGQSLETLMIAPKLIYDNGAEIILTIDGVNCLLYSDLENFIPSYPGQTAKASVKYYLNQNQLISMPVNSESGVRYITKSVDIIVIENDDTEYYGKVSVIPVYNTNTSSWELKFFLYLIEDEGVYDITNNVTVEVAFPDEPSYTRTFDGQEYDNEQILSISYDLKDIIPSITTPMDRIQTTAIKLNPVNEYVKFIIRSPGNETPNDPGIVYGANGAGVDRPIIRYNAATEKYYIPQSIFSSKEYMLENFYYKANPPYDLTMLNYPVPTPTHMRFLDSNGNPLITNPIDISSDTTYYQEYTLTQPSNGYFVNKTIIVEFLTSTGVDTYHSIYGVPVDVIAGP